MSDAIKIMLDKYDLQSISDYENALKEIIQEIALLGFWRSKFFEKAAFYGGTALRIMYGLDRFSEDIDFSLLKPDPDFSIASYAKAVSEELSAFGFKVSVTRKDKNVDTNIESAFIKGGTIQNLFTIDAPSDIAKKTHINKSLKIKLEIDIDPPSGFTTEAKYLLNPIPFSVNTYTLPSLFAGKMHALLCRVWKNRVKGRDWYDFIWYLRKNVSINLAHLEQRMKQSGHLDISDTLTKEKLKSLYVDKVNSTDFELAKKDVFPFIKDADTLAVWSKDFFMQMGEKL